MVPLRDVINDYLLSEKKVEPYNIMLFRGIVNLIFMLIFTLFIFLFDLIEYFSIFNDGIFLWMLLKIAFLILIIISSMSKYYNLLVTIKNYTSFPAVFSYLPLYILKYMENRKDLEEDFHLNGEDLVNIFYIFFAVVFILVYCEIIKIRIKNEEDDYKNLLVKGIFSEENKKDIIEILKKENGLKNIEIVLDNEQIAKVIKENLKKFFVGEKLNFDELKSQAIGDLGRCLKSIKIGGNITEINRNNLDNESQTLEKAFKGIDEETENLIYKFPGQSAIGLGYYLLSLFIFNLKGDYESEIPISPGSAQTDSYNITINSDGSVEVQGRYISPFAISKKENNLSMMIEEVHTFKIEKTEDVYKTTNAKITVYKLEKADTGPNEKNLEKKKVLYQVSYNADEDNKINSF